MVVFFAQVMGLTVRKARVGDGLSSAEFIGFEYIWMR